MDIEMAMAFKAEAERHLKRAKSDIESLQSKLKEAESENKKLKHELKLLEKS